MYRLLNFYRTTSKVGWCQLTENFSVLNATLAIFLRGDGSKKVSKKKRKYLKCLVPKKRKETIVNCGPNRFKKKKKKKKTGNMYVDRCMRIWRLQQIVIVRLLHIMFVCGTKNEDFDWNASLDVFQLFLVLCKFVVSFPVIVGYGHAEQDSFEPDEVCCGRRWCKSTSLSHLFYSCLYPYGIITIATAAL